MIAGNSLRGETRSSHVSMLARQITNLTLVRLRSITSRDFSSPIRIKVGAS
jgi:hypothetical protein